MVLVDTNIVGELARKGPNQGVVLWSRTVGEIVLSAITVEEIAFGLSLRPNARVEEWFSRFMESAVSVLPVTLEISHLAGTLRGRLAASGEVRSQADMLIAATAQIHRLNLVTRNPRDFSHCGISVFNPFS